MKRAYSLGFILGIVLLIAGGVAGTKLQKKNAGQAKQQGELERYRAELVDATPVQLGALTDRQRIHSRLYNHYKIVTGGRLLSGLAAKAKGEGDFVGTMVDVGLGPALTEPDTPEHYFGNLTQKSDVVIRGRAISKTSQITEDDSFIFTDYDIVIAEVLKNSKASHLQAGTTITITRPGGK
jgi:hypothetical protein